MSTPLPCDTPHDCEPPEVETRRDCNRNAFKNSSDCETPMEECFTTTRSEGQSEMDRNVRSARLETRVRRSTVRSNESVAMDHT